MEQESVKLERATEAGTHDENGLFGYLEGVLRYWKGVLGLQDWVIKLDINCHSKEMLLPDCAGATEWTECIKSAWITILNPDEYGERIVPFDMEKTLVHELLHLKFCLLGESGNDFQDRYVHQLIDDMARALVAARRDTVEEDDT